MSRFLLHTTIILTTLSTVLSSYATSKEQESFKKLGDITHQLLFKANPPLAKLGAQLRAISHPITPSTPSLHNDPVLHYVGKNIPKELTLVSQDTTARYPKYSKRSLVRYLSYCFRCHAKASVNQSSFWNTVTPDMSRSGNNEKTHFYRLITDHANAIKILQQSLLEPRSSKSRPDEAMRNLKILMIELTLNKQPPESLQRFIKKYAPAIQRKKSYHKALSEWSKHLKTWSQVAIPVLKREKVTFLKSLIEAAGKLELRNSQSGFIYRLRALKITRDLLEDPVPDDTLQQIFALGMQNTEALDELLPYPEAETFAEACVRTAPKRPLAARCYKRWQKISNRYFDSSPGPEAFQLLSQDLRKTITGR